MICCDVAKTFERIYFGRGTGYRSFSCDTIVGTHRRKRRGHVGTRCGCKRWSGRCLHWSRRFGRYVHAVNEAEGRLKLVDDNIRAYFATGPFAESVRRLRCFRGIRELTALTIAAELGDARRFPSAPRVMGFAGLVPSEHSSGSRRGRGAITKTGNAHLRRVLLEAAWHYRHHPHLGLSLRTRQEGAPPDVVARAWQAQHRLFRTYRRLVGRGRPPQLATTAVARELAGFVWATLAS